MTKSCNRLSMLKIMFAGSVLAAAPVCDAAADGSAARFEAAPAGFDALHASDADLQRYGLPPRPAASVGRDAYAAWAHQVGGASIYVSPALRQTTVRHRPMLHAQGAPAARIPQSIRNGTNVTSSNWSGIADVSSVGSFGPTSVYAIFGEWVVPIAQQAFNQCTGGTDYAATWIGIDGFNSNDVFQGGTEADATCINGTKKASYYAWYEWYPNYSIEITNFPVSPGDDIAAELVASTNTHGTLYLTNETTTQYTAIPFNAPAGTYLVGNSSEWIVERPEVDGKLATLTNYVTDFMTNMVALLNNGSPIFGGAGTGANPVYDITMLDNSNNAISVPYAVGAATIAYHDEGSAR